MGISDKLLALMPDMVRWLYNKKYDRPNPLKGGVYMIEGSRGCIHGDSDLLLANGTTIKIKDFKGGMIKTFDGVSLVDTYAAPAVKYPAKKLYKITTENGNSFIGTSNHFVLTDGLFLPLEATKSVALLSSQSLPDSISGISLLEYEQGVRRLIGITLGFLYGCLVDCRLCDEPLLLEEDTYLSVVPSLIDVLLSNDDVSLHKDGLSVREHIHNRSCQYVDHLSTLVAHLLSLEQHFEETDTYTCAKLSELLTGFYQTSQQFLLSYNHYDTIYLLLSQIQDMLTLINQDENLSNILKLSSCAFDDTSFTDSFVVFDNKDTELYSSVKKIEYYGEEEYYDIFVPYFHNYIANGFIHHNSGKSQAMARMVGQLLECGYADSATVGIITEAALDESIISLFDDIFEAQIDETESKAKYRQLKSGQEIFFKGFHPSKKTALKGTERATEILFIDECEWNNIDAAAKTLNTYIRAGGIIILVSNKFSSDLKVWGESVGAKYIRIDYWENPHLDERTKTTWDTLRETDPDLWRATIMYQGESDEYVRLFSNIDIDRMMGSESPHPVGTAIVKAISQDFAIGGMDKNVQTLGIKDENGIYHLWVKQGNTLTTEKLLASIMTVKQEFKPDIFIGDSVGQGLPIMQMIGEESPTNIYFNGGKEPHVEGYYNLRASTFGKLKDYANKYLIVIHADPLVQTRIREDLRGVILAPEDKDGKIKIMPKERIRKVLGRSPDYADSIAMCVYALDQGTVYNDSNYTDNPRRMGSFDNTWDW